MTRAAPSGGIYIFISCFYPKWLRIVKTGSASPWSNWGLRVQLKTQEWNHSGDFRIWTGVLLLMGPVRGLAHLATHCPRDIFIGMCSSPPSGAVLWPLPAVLVMGAGPLQPGMLPDPARAPGHAARRPAVPAVLEGLHAGQQDRQPGGLRTDLPLVGLRSSRCAKHSWFQTQPFSTLVDAGSRMPLNDGRWLRTYRLAFQVPVSNAVNIHTVKCTAV